MINKIQPVFIRDTASVTPLGDTWSETWGGLLENKKEAETYHSLRPELALHCPVSSIAKLDRNLIKNTNRLAGPTYHLLKSVCDAFLNQATTSFNALYFGSAYSEAEILFQLAQQEFAQAEATLPATAWNNILEEPLSHLFLEAYPAIPRQQWLASSCTSGMHALGQAWLEMSTEKKTQETLVAAVDSLTPVAVSGFSRSGAISTTGCAPFQKNASGMTPGEAAAAIHLSSTPNENDNIRLSGLGLACEPIHPTHHSPEGDGLYNAATRALQSAQCNPEQVDAVILHGTGTTANDRSEFNAYQRLFPHGGKQPWATAIKGHLGHAMGASGLLNALVAAQSCQTKLLPPTHTNPESILSGMPLAHEVISFKNHPRLLILCSGFGGNHTAALIEKA